jgi:hypothetical protein
MQKMLAAGYVTLCVERKLKIPGIHFYFSFDRDLSANTKG